MNNWNQVSLQEVCKITRGASPRPIKDWITEDLKGIPWVKISDATTSKTRFIKHTSERIKQEGISKSVSVVPGDLIVSNSATPGLPKFMDINACIHDGWLLIREFEGIDKEFLYYLLINDRKYLVSQGTGTVFTNLKTDILKNHIIQLPTINVQKTIASFLSKLDSKIEVNQKMNETLEEIAKTLFKSWFIDFDQVKAKAEGRPTGLSKEISDLFPDSFEDSELGEIPSGWKIGKLSDVTDITMGQSPPGHTYNEDEEGLPFYQGSTDFGFRFPSVRKYCTTPKKIAKIDDVLLSVRAPVGDINRANVKCCIGRGLASIRSKYNFQSWAHYRCSFLNREFESFNSEGTVFGAINGKDLKSLPISLPQIEIIEGFEKLINPLDRKISILSEEILILNKLRDTLLPKLISGELQIPDAENLVEEAGI